MIEKEGVKKLSISLPAELHQELEEFHKQTDRKKSNIMAKALKEYLEREKK